MKKDPTLNDVSSALNKEVDLLIISGEHSGDELASDLVSDLKKIKPELQIVSIGGREIEKLGVPLLFNLVDHSVFGFTDVLKQYPFFKQLLDNTLTWIDSHRPKNICFVDYPGFNLRLAKALHQSGLSVKGGGKIQLFYYVSPQIWAWKKQRRFEMERYLDALATLLPFEKACYSDTALPVTYVGHPFAKDDYPSGLQYDPKGPILLLPGSRKASVEKHGPILLETFEKLRREDPSLEAQIIYPSLTIKSSLDALLNKYPTVKESVHLIKNDFDHLGCRMTVMSSGTMSLSIALSGIPGIVIYSLSNLNYWILKSFVQVQFICLANLILNRELYPELIQKDVEANTIFNHIRALMSDTQVQKRFEEASKEIKKVLYEDREKSVAHWLDSNIRT